MTVEILVGGLVQGVGFRAFVESHARRLGISGAAVNLADGRVRIIAQGSEAAVAELTRQVRTGPRLARVGEVTTNLIQPVESPGPGFRIG